MTDITTRLGRKFSKISLGGVTEDNLEEVGEGDEEVKVKSDDVTDETSPDDIHEDTSNENYEKPDNKDKFMDDDINTFGIDDQIKGSDTRSDYHKDNEGPFMKDWDNLESEEDLDGNKEAEEDLHPDESFMREGSVVNIDGNVDTPEEEDDFNDDDTMDSAVGEVPEKDLAYKYKDVFDGETATEELAVEEEMLTEERTLGFEVDKEIEESSTAKIEANESEESFYSEEELEDLDVTESADIDDAGGAKEEVNEIESTTLADIFEIDDTKQETDSVEENDDMKETSKDPARETTATEMSGGIDVTETEAFTEAEGQEESDDPDSEYEDVTESTEKGLNDETDMNKTGQGNGSNEPKFEGKIEVLPIRLVSNFVFTFFFIYFTKR